MNRRRAKVFRQGNGTVVVLPHDWVDGMEIRPGDRVEIIYNGEVRIRKLEDRDAEGGT